MYEVHFHLERRPFAATPDPGCCYLSSTWAIQLQQIRSCVEQGRGIAIFTGPAGIGKTLLSQVLLAEFQARFAGVYLGTGQFATRRAFLQAILYELGQPYGGMSDQELRLELNTALRSLITQKDGLLLILDEAHLLSDRLLEEVRQLSDLALQGVPLVRVVLCGNPELEERLTSSALSAFNQRVACHESIETLRRAESIEFLAHRISWAGGEIAKLFQPGALDLIANASDGVPRCLNQLADHSLSQTYLAGDSIVTEVNVRKSLAALQSLPLRWNASALLEKSWVSTQHAENSAQESDNSLELQPECEPTLATAGADVIAAPHEAVLETAYGSESACFEFGVGDDSAFETTAEIPTEQVSAEVPFASIADQHTTEFSDPENSWAIAPDAPESETIELYFDSAAVLDLIDDEPEDLHSAAIGREADEDLDRPLFAWLINPAAHTGPETTEQAIGKSARGMSRHSASSHEEPVEERVLDPFGDRHFANRPASVKFSIRSPEANSQKQLKDNDPTANQHHSAAAGKRFVPRLHLTAAGSSYLADNQNRELHEADPIEEVVIDPYATLDAESRPISKKLLYPKLTDTVEETNAAQNAYQPATVNTPGDPSGITEFPAEAESDAAIQPDAVVSHFDSNENLPLHPVDQIDSICALLEIADEPSGTGSGVELITDWGVERIDIDLSCETQLQEQASGVPPFQLNLQDFLGSMVVDIGRNLSQQQAAPPATPEPVAKSQSTVPTGPMKSQKAPASPEIAETSQPDVGTAPVQRINRYDVVQPVDIDEPIDALDEETPTRDLEPAIQFEEDQEMEPQATASANAPAAPHSSFHNLFSSLRRRKSSQGRF